MGYDYDKAEGGKNWGDALFFVFALALLVGLVAGLPARGMELSPGMPGYVPPVVNDTPVELDSIQGVVIPVVRLKVLRPVVAEMAVTPLPVAAVSTADIFYLRTVLCVPGTVQVDVLAVAGAVLGVTGVDVQRLSALDVQTVGKLVKAWGKLYGANFDGFQQAHLTAPGDVVAAVETARVDWWAARLKTAADVPAVAMPEALRGVRWVAEIDVPATAGEFENVLRELAWFRARGYGGALFVWRGETVGLGLWHELARRAKAAGWKVMFAYGPEEKATENAAYFDPAAFEVAAAPVLAVADCALLGWRAAAQPHWAKGAGDWGRVVAGELRRLAPGLPIVGDVFIHGDRKVTSTMPPCAGAALVINAGAETFIPEGVARLVGGELPKLCLVTGVAPYWRYFLRPDVTLPQVAAACIRTEQNFLDAGWFGTVTLAGDGAGERRGNTDSLCKSQWRNVQQEQ
jgi:hypothetical protein